MYAEDPFRSTQNEFYRLKGQLAAGQITQQQFDDALKGMMVEHGGRWWMIGTQSGKWYTHDGKNWVESQPPTGQPQVTYAPPERISRGPWVDARTEAMPSAVPVMAGFGRRVGAYLIDLAIVFLAALLETSFLGTETTGTVIGMLLVVGYYVGFWAQGDQTIGKMLLGIKVVRTDGSPVSLGRALVRYIGYQIDGLFLGLGFLWAAWDSKKQGWHDKIAGTYVVRS